MASSGVEYYGYCWNADLCTGGPSVPANQDPDNLPDIHVEPELTQELPPFQPPDTGPSVPVEENVSVQRMAASPIRGKYAYVRVSSIT